MIIIVINMLLKMLNLKYFMNHISTLLTNRRFNYLYSSTWDRFVSRSVFIPTFYVRNENIWQDGFLFDFLQKKTADAWVRRFVIYTGFLFSERLVFDVVVRIYLDNLIWPGHSSSLFETSNVSEMLTSVIFTLVTIWFLILSIYLLILF